MKQRFSSFDIKVIAHELSQTLPSLRVVNIYDLSSRIFLLKFAKPDHRHQLVIDSGFRCHLTAFSRTTAAAPSTFVARLRKFLKTRRVTAVKQVGTDRILELQFSEGSYRLFLEFYAGGNIVLTDRELNVLAVLRSLSEGAEHEQVRPGSVYNLSERQNINGVPPVSGERVREGLKKFIERQQLPSSDAAQSKKSKKKTEDTLRKALAGTFSEFPPMLFEHALREKGFDATLSPEDVLGDDALVQQLLGVLGEAQKVVAEVMNANPVKGYIVAKQSSAARASESKTRQLLANEEGAPTEPAGKLMYDDYHPFKPKQCVDDASVTMLEFEGFNAAVDDFYSSIEGQKLESRLHEKEEAARKKLEHARDDQAKRLGGLQAVQELNDRKAQAIEANLARVEEATAAINGLIAQGMDWIEIDRLIELEQKRNNPVAEIIRLPLKLNENTATLLLGELESAEDEGVEDDKTDSDPSESESEGEPAPKKRSKPKAASKPNRTIDKRLAIDIDLALSGWSNAREYYDQKKSAAAKEEKTLLASTKALRSAQQKIEGDLKRTLKEEKAVLRPVRQAFWFEKFVYFISSDGYLVLGGKDAQQNETLYNRYLKKGDIYVHADLNGAASVIVKNNSATPNAPIPPSTLSQAGNLSVATSTAWDSKAVMSAWWVPAEQVSKNSPSGDIMTPGTFNIKGSKNFLPPAQLLLGFAVLFQISEDSKANHTRHRVPLTIRERDEAIQQAPLERYGQSDENEKPRDAVAFANMQEDGEAEEEKEDEGEDDEEEEDAASETASETNGESAEPVLTYANPLQSQSHGVANSASECEDEDAISEASDTDPDEMLDRIEHPDAAQPEQASTMTTEADDDEESASDVEISQITNQNTYTSNATTKLQPQVRGKRGKRKKIALKYAGQDESDRALAMALLGSRAGQEKAAAVAEAKTAKEAETAQAKQHRRERHERKLAESKRRDAAKEAAANAGGLDDERDDQTSPATNIDLSTLIGKPLPTDTLLTAIPICAPWSALHTYKYKVKLQPGSTKKGKAVREILAKWSAAGANKRNVDESGMDGERIWPREMELIRGWKDTEIFGVVPVKGCRVVMGKAEGAAVSKGGVKGKVRGGRGGRGGKKR